MSLHPTRTPSPSEVLAASSREIPKSLKTATLVAFVIGAVICLVGLFLDPERAWRAFHAKWLFFAAFNGTAGLSVSIPKPWTLRNFDAILT